MEIKLNHSETTFRSNFREVFSLSFEKYVNKETERFHTNIGKRKVKFEFAECFNKIKKKK
jgi:hypothetical protein